MKLTRAFFTLLICLHLLPSTAQQSQSNQQLKYQIASHKLLRKAEFIEDPTVLSLLAKQAENFAIRYDFENEIAADLHRISYKAFKSSLAYGLIDSNTSLTSKEAFEIADSTMNQYHGHFPKKKKSEKWVVVRSVFLTNDDKYFYSAGADGKILKWDVATRQNELIYQSDKIDRIIKLSSNDQWIAYATNEDEIYLINLAASPIEPIEIKNHRGSILDLVFTPDNTAVISVGTDRRIVYHSLLKDEIKTISEYPNSPTDMSISPSGKLLAVASRSGEIALFNLTSDNMDPRMFYLSESNTKVIEGIQFSSSGKYLAYGGYKTDSGYGYITLLDIIDGKLFGPDLIGFTSGVQAIQFDPSDSKIAGASRDYTVKVWSLDDRRIFDLPVALNDHEGWVWSIDFNTSGSELFTASADGKIRKFSLNASSYLVNTCSQVQRNLSDFEWLNYIGDPKDFPYEKTCPEIN